MISIKEGKTNCVLQDNAYIITSKALFSFVETDKPSQLSSVPKNIR